MVKPDTSIAFTETFARNQKKIIPQNLPNEKKIWESSMVKNPGKHLNKTTYHIVLETQSDWLATPEPCFPSTENSTLASRGKL